MNEPLTIGTLAKAAGVNVETVRYYERRGLIARPRKPAVGYRVYPLKTLDRIKFIKRAQELGFTLHEIKNLLILEDRPCREVRDLASQKLNQVRARITDLCRLEAVLDELVEQCRSNPDDSHCPIIQALLSEP